MHRIKSQPGRSWRAWLPLLAACALAPLAGRAQVIVLKNGQRAPASELRREGQTLLTTVEVAGQKGEVGYGLDAIDHLELPRPPQLEQAQQALLAGKPAEALTLSEAVAAASFAWRDIRGGYWAQASLIKAAALQALNRSDEATSLLGTLATDPADANSALVAKSRLAGLLALGGKAKASQANQLADSIIGASDDASVLAEAWLAKGRAQAAQGEYDDALAAFLHLPVFYNDNPGNVAQAMLGAGRVYLALRDDKRAVRTFLELQEEFPGSREAAEAKKELDRGGENMAKLAAQIAENRTAANNRLKELQAAQGNPPDK